MHGYSSIVYVSRKKFRVSSCLLVQKLDMGVLFYSHPRNVKNHLTIANASVSIHQCKRPLSIINYHLVSWWFLQWDKKILQTWEHTSTRKASPARSKFDFFVPPNCWENSGCLWQARETINKSNEIAHGVTGRWPLTQWTDNWFQPVPSCGGLQQLQKQRLPQRHEKNRTPTKDLHALKSHELHNILTYWMGIKDDDGQDIWKDLEIFRSYHYGSNLSVLVIHTFWAEKPCKYRMKDAFTSQEIKASKVVQVVIKPPTWKCPSEIGSLPLFWGGKHEKNMWNHHLLHSSHLFAVTRTFSYGEKTQWSTDLPVHGWSWCW